MNSFVTDIMALVLYLEQRRLSSAVKILFEQAEQKQIHIFIPTIVLAEILYLSEKERISAKNHDVKKLIQIYSSFQVQAFIFYPIFFIK